MTNTMTYKGYAARIEYDDEDAIFTGRIAGIRDGVGFHADTVEGLREAFHEAVEDTLRLAPRSARNRRRPIRGRSCSGSALMFTARPHWPPSCRARA